MQERLCFKIQRPPNRIEGYSLLIDNSTKAVEWMMLAGVLDDIGREEVSMLLAGDQTVPVAKITTEKILTVLVPVCGHPITPRITGEYFVPACACQYHFDEPACQSRSVIIWITHARSKIFNRPDHPR